MRKKFAFVILFVFSTVIIFFVYENVYYIPQIAIMFLSPLVLLKEGIRKEDRLPLLLVFSILLTIVVHPESFRLSSVGYSVLFVFTYICYTKIFSKSNIQLKEFQNFIKGIIIAYTIVLVLQLVMRLVGLEPINASYNTEEGYKFNSLAFEASQIGPIITILIYIYIKIEELKYGQKISLNEIIKGNNRKVFICYVSTCLLSFSVTSYFALIVLLMYFIRAKHLLIGLLMLTLGIFIFFSLGTETGDRILALLEVLSSMDVRTIYEVDPSGSARIAPPLIFFKELNLFSVNSWIGYGCDYGSSHIWHILIDDETSNENMAVIGIFGFIYDYGLIPFLIFMKFLHSLCKFKSYAFFIYLTCFFTAGFNWASTWLFFMVIFSLNHFQIINKCTNKYQLSSQLLMPQKH